jgi:four helix bundle protein
MVAKLGIVEEEADESIYWIELIIESTMMRKARLAPLLDEMNQILALVVASQKTMRRNLNPKSKTQNPKSP